MAIRAVFFDFGDTLIDNSSFARKNASRLHQKFLARHGIRLSLARTGELRRRAAEVAEAKHGGTPAKHGTFVYFSEFMRLADPSGKVPEREWKEYYLSFREKWFGAKTLLPGARPLLKFLKRKGMKLALVSNASIEAFERDLATAGISEYFHHLVISEKVGAEKSRFVPYQIALKKLRVKPSETIMVGDNLFEDVHSARLLGLGTIRLDYGNWRRYRRGEYEEADYVAKDLAQVGKRLAQLTG